MKLVILALTSVLLLSGCTLLGTKEPDAQTRTVILPVEIFPPLRPEPVSTVTVDWQVLPPRTTTTASVIGLSTRDYENMVLFNYDIVRYMRQLQAIIEYYERSIEQHNAQIEERNNDTTGDK